MARVMQCDKRSFVQKLFTDIAARYDLFNRVASCGLDQRWRRLALEYGKIEPGHSVLDVCSGTGDLSILCALRQRGRGLVVSIDMNRAMLLRAQNKKYAQRTPISLLQADALSLPFPDCCFDRVLIGFSTRNLNDFTQGIREMVRVLRYGGVLVILETGYPRNHFLRACYQMFLFTAARLIGFMLTGRFWPFTYLAKSVKSFLSPGQVVEGLSDLSTDVTYVPLSHGFASLYLATKR